MHKLKQRREDHSQACLCLRCVETEHNINTLQECAMEFKCIAQLREPQTETQAALSKSHEVSPFLWHSLHTCPDRQVINVAVFLNTSKMELTTCDSTSSLGSNAKCFHANTRFTF